MQAGAVRLVDGAGVAVGRGGLREGLSEMFTVSRLNVERAVGVAESGLLCRRASSRSSRRWSSSVTSAASRSIGAIGSVWAWSSRVSRTSAIPERRSLRSAWSIVVGVVKHPAPPLSCRGEEFSVTTGGDYWVTGDT